MKSVRFECGKCGSTLGLDAQPNTDEGVVVVYVAPCVVCNLKTYTEASKDNFDRICQELVAKLEKETR